jgi:hypothetical protein
MMYELSRSEDPDDRAVVGSVELGVLQPAASA